MIDANGVEINEVLDDEVESDFCECDRPVKVTSEQVSMGPDGIEYLETEYCENCNLPII